MRRDSPTSLLDAVLFKAEQSDLNTLKTSQNCASQLLYLPRKLGCSDGAGCAVSAATPSASCCKPPSLNLKPGCRCQPYLQYVCNQSYGRALLLGRILRCLTRSVCPTIDRKPQWMSNLQTSTPPGRTVAQKILHGYFAHFRAF